MNKKLFSLKKHGPIFSGSIILGISFPLFRKYKETGILTLSNIIISIITLFITLSIIFFVVRHANKPEKGE